MSHSSAAFVFRDGTVLHGEYSGGSDSMLTNMFATQDERDASWRKQYWRECTCGKPSEQCVAYSTYGWGHWWWGEACRSCMAFIGPLTSEDVDEFRSDHVPTFEEAVARTQSGSGT